MKAINGKKICSKCKDEKDIDQYCKNRSMIDGLNNYCKICAYEKQKERMKIPIARSMANNRTKKWRDNNKDKVKEYYQQYKERPSTKAHLQKPDVKERRKKAARKFKSDFFLKNGISVYKSNKIKHPDRFKKYEKTHYDKSVKQLDNRYLTHRLRVDGFDLEDIKKNTILIEIKSLIIQFKRHEKHGRAS